MKVIGGFYLWILIAIRFFRYVAAQRTADLEQRVNRSRLTYDDVARAFDEAGDAPREHQPG